MIRSTVDFGIDLGTTSSILAVHDGVRPVVVPNREGENLTPSALAFEASGRLYVGREAREQYFRDSENAEIEFKLRMNLGKRGAKFFPNAGRRLLPEEMSAEILKALRESGQAHLGEGIHAAVVTVPAAFGATACHATKAAAELAGLKQFWLLQEPVAAALAYGFDNADADSFWMIYDLGGGTFDASITQVRDGIIQVVKHAGDPYLGGKLIDWDIVEHVLAPPLRRQYHLPDFMRGSPQWNTAFAILKMLAEEAKIIVCETGQSHVIRHDGTQWSDAEAKPTPLEVELTPEMLSEISFPYFARTERLCRSVLEQAGLQPQDLDKIILVGGSTLNPFLREMIAKAFDRELEWSIDPLVVVARGAAVFAATMPVSASPEPEDSTCYRIDLEHQPVGMDLTPVVGGRVEAPDGRSLAEHTIEFRDTRSQWCSGKIRLGEDGVFVADLHAEEGRKCIYEIILLSPEARRLKTLPETLSYMVGGIVSVVPLSETIGVAMADNRVDVFFAKGVPLSDELRCQRTHRCAYSIPAGQDEVVFRIPLVEGDDLRADRNRLIGKVEISPMSFPVNLPAESDVQITLAINRSRLLTATAYVPFLDQAFEEVMTLQSPKPNAEAMRTTLEEQRRRVAKIKTSAAVVGGEERAKDFISQIEREDAFGQTEALLKTGETDPESMHACEERLRGLVRQVDKAEDSLEWSILVLRAESVLTETREVVQKQGSPSEREEMLRLQDNLDEAIRSNEPMLVRARTETIVELCLTIRMRTVEFWVKMFEQLQQERRDKEQDSEIDRLIALGQEAIGTNDRDKLESAVRQLMGYLRLDSNDMLSRGYGGSTIRSEFRN